MQIFRCSKCKVGETDDCLLIVCNENMPPPLCPYKHSSTWFPEWKKISQNEKEEK